MSHGAAADAGAPFPSGHRGRARRSGDPRLRDRRDPRPPARRSCAPQRSAPWLAIPSPPAS